MGLTLHCELRLPGTIPSEEVDQRLDALREHALTLPFQDVSGRIEAPEGEPKNGLEHFLAVWAAVNARPCCEECPRLYGDVSTARGFAVFPGRGSEAALFGFMRRANRNGRATEWWWQMSCKTQYASVAGEAHFVHCHTTLVALIDHAIKLGIGVDVNDEGRYWETRDTNTLLNELNHMNHLVAGFAGAMSDAMPEGRKVSASIFEHPEFERLEMGPKSSE